METLFEGAEAKILKIDDSRLKKVRLAKSYRLEQIDHKIRKFRTRREFKVLSKLHELGLSVPEVYELSDCKEDFSFEFEYIHGPLLKDCINKGLLFEIFEQIVKMHEKDIVHGDLTTLNMIFDENKKRIVLIDFGLSDFSHKFEDKAVDLHLLFTCITNEHSDLIKYKEELLDLYSKKIESADKIFEKLERIEHRGRNK